MTIVFWEPVRYLYKDPKREPPGGCQMQHYRCTRCLAGAVGHRTLYCPSCGARTLDMPKEAGKDG